VEREEEKNLNGLNGVKEGNKSGRLLYYYT
jgi:hypothetical protein